MRELSGVRLVLHDHPSIEHSLPQVPDPDRSRNGLSFRSEVDDCQQVVALSTAQSRSGDPWRKDGPGQDTVRCHADLEACRNEARSWLAVHMQDGVKANSSAQARGPEENKERGRSR